MEDLIFKQEKHNFRITTRKISWLLDDNHVKIDYFNPMDLENGGYQRQKNDSHCENIANYIKKTMVEKNDFYLPSSIICSCRDEYSDDSLLYIVDGQHRIEALKKIKNEESDLYQKIKDYSLSLLILIKPTKEEEIQTFIDINKTSKKVDTSLATVLRNRLNKDKSTTSDDLLIPKRQYLSVELAWRLCNENHSDDNLYFDKIVFEGDTKNSNQYITLNAYYNSIKSYLKYLHQYKIVSNDWNTKDELESRFNDLQTIEIKTWNIVKDTWPELFKNDDCKILMGPIGFAAIHKVLNYFLQNSCKDYNYNVTDYMDDIKKVFESINIPFGLWKKGGDFSLYTSGSGYTQVSQIIITSSPLLLSLKK